MWIVRWRSREALGDFYRRVAEVAEVHGAWLLLFFGGMKPTREGACGSRRFSCLASGLSV